jgi:transposase InsO family protein
MSSGIGTLVDRVTRYVVLIHLPDGYKAPQLRDAIITQVQTIPAHLRKTLTWDQGREMALHEQISARTGFDVFFCDPHSPWQRGTNENINGLLRQYFPKHSRARSVGAVGLRPCPATSCRGVRRELTRVRGHFAEVRRAHCLHARRPRAVNPAEPSTLSGQSQIPRRLDIERLR